ncbi:serine/threonine-protein kinase [Streptomyces pseudovenezuelae]|uniref:non-specific serine/threonine protein kinase n=1 Tax=Streptomyces pseudovenezuelae TaxID=67350 RepID=A0ABT6LMD8_9ACTN|nr:serine/threonine-protein kinase [Streptomyces pseudovenezuelae]MDH6217476.1 serine/threonine protein kinase [Streptomyces pseudovenezuelae]
MGTEGAGVRVIAGRYRLESRLGRGGMGVVWRATDELLGRQVAVKEIPLDLDETLSVEETRRQRDRTLREARAVAQLRHPHIIVVHDVVEQDERPYLVMELIDGGSLADRISRRGPVDAPEAARIGIALLSALATAHAAGVLHRDIKPANVLLGSEGDRVVLTDFGIAQVAGATTLTETGAFVGSPEYTAPERMSGARTGPESDLWSLGGLLCTILSGESPFRRDSLGGILHAVVFDEIRPPAQAAPLLPVVRGLLERDPDRRLDAARAERMLRVYLETGRTPQLPPDYTPTRQDVPGPTPAPTTTPTPPSPTVETRRSTRGVLVAGLLVAAMAGAGVSAAALLMNGDGGGGGGGVPKSSGPGVSVSATSAPGSPTSLTSAPSTPVSGTPTAGTATPSASRPSSPAPTGGTHASAPSGYRVADDPAGFSLAVPEGFTRTLQGERVFYMSPGQTFRLGIKVTDPQTGGPLAVMRRAAAKGPDTNPGYHDGRVTETTHHELPAALWEFTWNGFSTAEGPRHTYDLCWEEGGRLYDVWVSAPVGKVREAKEYFDVAVDTFVRS